MNVKEVVPFLHVSSMERSIRFYIDGLGFAFRHKWEPEGQLRWCWLTLGGASLMLQEFPNRPMPANAGEGITLNFTCDDAIALYHQYRARGLDPSEPEVGNGLWVTEVTDPDGYKHFFNSPTDVAEDTKLSEIAST
jgi:catechol 2,3-dioxygenase-like lactoylglutathione lyase family enzyme